MDLTKSLNTENTQFLIQQGKKNLNNNRFFQFIDLIMGDPKLRSYIDEFFGDWDETKTVIMIMKTYQVIEIELKNRELKYGKLFNNEDRRKLIIGLIKEILANGECRQELIKNMNIFMNCNFNECQKFIKDKTDSFQLKKY
jgi:hypothetical protein